MWSLLTEFWSLLIGVNVSKAVSIAVIGNVVSWTFEILKNSKDGIWGRFYGISRLLFHPFVFKASKEYIEKYRSRRGKLRVLKMTNSIDLDDIYINVQFQGKKDERLVGFDVAKKEQFLMVLGEPGAGKSTFLRKVGLEILSGKEKIYKSQLLPVFLELKKFDDTEIDIYKIQGYIVKELNIFGFLDPQLFAKKALEQGRLLILFDGLDEVPDDFVRNAIYGIRDFVDKYDQNRFIISCRSAVHYSSAFPRFKTVTVAEFDDEQIRSYIESWFRSRRDHDKGIAEKSNRMARNCWNLLKSEDHKGAKHLAKTPLLLTFLCMVYEHSQNFSRNKSSLYSRALRILLEEWSAEKQINKEKMLLDVDLEESLLSEIAFNNFVRNRSKFGRRELIKDIRGFIFENENAPKNIDATKVLEEISVRQGILVEQSDGEFSFSHLTIQEYLASQYIIGNALSEKAIEKCLIKRGWCEVFQLISGSLKYQKTTDAFLRKISKEIAKMLVNSSHSERLSRVLQLAEDKTEDSEGQLTEIARRAAANAYMYAFIKASKLVKDIAIKDKSGRLAGSRIALGKLNLIPDSEYNPTYINHIAHHYTNSSVIAFSNVREIIGITAK